MAGVIDRLQKLETTLNSQGQSSVKDALDKSTIAMQKADELNSRLTSTQVEVAELSKHIDHLTSLFEKTLKMLGVNV